MILAAKLWAFDAMEGRLTFGVCIDFYFGAFFLDTHIMPRISNVPEYVVQCDGF